MREIKFRAWDIAHKEIKNVRQLLLNFADIHTLYEDPNDVEQTCWSLVGTDCILMQFTGLLDKNGKEIYEGDIFKEGTAGITTVIFENGTFKLKEVENSIWLCATHEFGEIIGNIYENSELLK